MLTRTRMKCLFMSTLTIGEPARLPARTHVREVLGILALRVLLLKHVGVRLIPALQDLRLLTSDIFMPMTVNGRLILADELITAHA